MGKEQSFPKSLCKSCDCLWHDVTALWCHPCYFQIQSYICCAMVLSGNSSIVFLDYDITMHHQSSHFPACSVYVLCLLSPMGVSLLCILILWFFHDFPWLSMTVGTLQHHNINNIGYLATASSSGSCSAISSSRSSAVGFRFWAVEGSTSWLPGWLNMVRWKWVENEWMLAPPSEARRPKACCDPPGKKIYQHSNHEFHENLSFRHILFHENLLFWYWQEVDFTKYD